MAEILHQLIDISSKYLYTGFYMSQVVQDFFHQQYDSFLLFQVCLFADLSHPKRGSKDAVESLLTIFRGCI